jgi:hypothetical protein
MAAGAGTKDALPISRKEPTTKPVEAPTIAVCAALVVLVLAILGVVYLSIGVAHMFGGHWQRWFGPYDPVEYTVTIAAVSGLDPTKNLRQGPALALLDLAFNLTLGIASPRTARCRECVQAGTTVEVSYLRSGVPLATGPAPVFCVKVSKHREDGSVIAWGDGVRLQGFVLDSLSVDILHGAPEFGVKLTLPLQWFCSSTVDVIGGSRGAGGLQPPWAKIPGSSSSEPSAASPKFSTEP